MKFVIILMSFSSLAVSSAQLPSGITDCGANIFVVYPFIDLKANVTFFLTNRDDRSASKQIYIDDQDLTLSLKSRPIVFIVHGWCQSQYKPWISKLVQAWLDAVDCNVIVVDYSGLASYSYDIAVTYVPLVGGYLCSFVNELKNGGILGNDITIAGHSLGAHVAGIAGSCIGDLGTIYALDAAGPSYTTKPQSERLDPTDANWVSAIHTSIDLGIAINIGHSDFYINSGTSSQCGCVYPQASDVTNPNEPFCSHTMSITLFIHSLDESIKCKGIQGCSTASMLSASNACVLVTSNPYNLVAFPVCVYDILGIYSKRIPGRFVVPTKYAVPHCFS